jgi:hypothetical protein
MFHVNGTRKCEICGKVFNLISYNQQYCGEKCKREAKSLYCRDKRRLNAQTKTKNDTLSEVARKANAMGLTYGQYMALQKGR